MSGNVREIITKAIVSKGSKKSIKKHSFTFEDITKVLGCWLTNHNYCAYFDEGQPVVKGTYDLHLWYSFVDGKDSTIFKTQIEYLDKMDVISHDERTFDTSDTIEPICNIEPKCIGAVLEQGNVSIEIEKEMAIRIIGDACLKIKTHQELDQFDITEINENFLG